MLTSVQGDIWAVVLDPATHAAVDFERLTFGPGSERDSPHAAANGRNRLCRCHQPNQHLGAARGHRDGHGARRLPPADRGPRTVRAGHGMPADERWVAFMGPRRPSPSIVVKDMVSGHLRDLGVVVGSPYGPVISPDGSRVAYQASADEWRTVAVSGGAPQPLCRDCKEAGDWYPGRPPGGREHGRRHGLPRARRRGDGTDGAAGQQRRRAIAEPSAPQLRQPLDRLSGTEADQQVYVPTFGRTRPIPETDWIAIGSREADVRPVGWSPSGRMLYLFSSRDGFRCLYAQRIDVGSGRPLGEATLVRHLHNVRVAGGGGAVGDQHRCRQRGGPPSRIIFDFPDQAVNVWGMRLGPLTPPNAPAATP